MWDLKVCVPKMARSDFSLCKFCFPPMVPSVLWGVGGGGRVQGDEVLQMPWPNLVHFCCAKFRLLPIPPPNPPERRLRSLHFWDTHTAHLRGLCHIGIALGCVVLPLLRPQQRLNPGLHCSA